jgi:hypothetical protein
MFGLLLIVLIVYNDDPFSGIGFAIATWRPVMKLLATTMLVASVALAAPVTVDAANAQTKTYQAPKLRSPPPPSNLRPGKGYDPDPFIQGEILRHRNSGWPD